MLFFPPIPQSAMGYHICSLGIKQNPALECHSQTPQEEAQAVNSSHCSFFLSGCALELQGTGKALTAPSAPWCSGFSTQGQILKGLKLTGHAADKPRGFKGPRTGCGSDGSDKS